MQLENIKAAILDGIRTPSTKEMLEQAERRAAELEATLQTSVVKSKVAILPTVVESYLKDFRGPASGHSARENAPGEIGWTHYPCGGMGNVY